MSKTVHRSITIRHLRGIEELFFPIPDHGCYLLTGTNGAGKTTLLVALYRIGYNLAFRYSFPSSDSSNTLIDVYTDASITYRSGDDEVRYEYGGTRWVPRPKSKSGILKQFGFGEVIFVRADSGRIEPNQRELIDRPPTLAPKDLRDSLKRVFEDGRFDNLVTMKTGRGRSRPAYLVREQPRSQRYFSEKHFSTGEICIIRLVERVQRAKKGSAVLVDELEMALHPRLQVRLFELLKELAKERDLLVLVSTHSTSMIRAARPEDIFFLERDPTQPKNVLCSNPCYPAKASLGIAYDNETNPDHVFLVEDTRARALLQQLIERYKLIRNDRAFAPLCKILPIGGWVQVLEFLDASVGYLFTGHTKTTCFLDADVAQSLTDQAANKTAGGRRLSQLSQKHRKAIHYLPITPEHGFVEFLEDDPFRAAKLIDKRFDNEVSTIKIIESAPYRKHTDPKPKFSHILGEISDITNRGHEFVERILFAVYVETSMSDGDVSKSMGPVFA